MRLTWVVVAAAVAATGCGSQAARQPARNSARVAGSFARAVLGGRCARAERLLSDPTNDAVRGAFESSCSIWRGFPARLVGRGQRSRGAWAFRYSGSQVAGGVTKTESGTVLVYVTDTDAGPRVESVQYADQRSGAQGHLGG